jgi:hypothetical protein
MEISACPACGSTDIRYERTTVDQFKLDSWRSADDRPVFVSEPEIFESSMTDRVVCANGHAHPDRVGFDLEWVERG